VLAYLKDYDHKL